MQQLTSIPSGRLQSISKAELYGTVAIIALTLGYYFFPLLHYGENAVVRVFDFLDGDFVYRIALAKSHTIFALDPMTPVNNVMNGLPRACLPSGLNVYQWIIFLFPNYTGFLVNYILVHLLGFIGMYLFLNNHILKQSGQKPLAFLVALAFSILPIYTITGLAVIGIPLLVNAILFIQKGEGKLKHYLAIMLYAFYCFYNMFPIVIFAAGAYFAWDLIHNWKFNRKLFGGISLLVGCLLIAEYQVIYTFIFHKIIPHRLVEHYVTSLNYKGVFIETLQTVCNGIISSANYPFYLVGLSLALVAAYLIIFRKGPLIHISILRAPILTRALNQATYLWYDSTGSRFLKNRLLLSTGSNDGFSENPRFTSALSDNRHQNTSPKVSLQMKLFLLVFMVSLGVAIWDWYQFQFLFDKYSFFNMFSFKRINCFLPFLVFALFAAAMGLLDRRLKWLKFILIPVILFSTLKMDYAFDHSENSDYGKLSYHQFFSEQLFKDIDAYIGKPKNSYRVCDIGLLPSESQYNGFYTLDSYQYLYPMQYRQQFMKIIQGELNKSPDLTTFFSSPRGGPNVCFTFSAEEYAAKNAGKKITEINNMDLNYDALKSMNCQYIFSLYRVKKFTSDNIVFEKEFSDSQSPFHIYLYKVI